MPRPGFVLEVDRSTPPLLFWRGEGFSLERLPAGRTRVVYGPEPLDPVKDVDGAIRRALLDPVESRPAAGPAVPGHEADHRLRRRQPAAAQDAPAGPAPAGDRGRARPGRRGRRGRRAPHRRARPPPAHDRGRAAPRRGRPGLRRLRPRRPALQPRRRGSRQPGLPGVHPEGRGGGDQQAGRRERPHRLRQHQPRRHGRRLEVHRHRAGVVPQPPPPPQRVDHAAVEVVHGPARQRAAQVQLAAGQGHHRRRRQGLPDRDHAQHRHLPRPVRLPGQAGVGVVPARPGHLRRHHQGAEAHAGAGEAEDLPVDGVPAPDDRRAGRRGRGRPPPDDGAGLPAADGAGGGPDRHPDHGHPLHLPVQRGLDHEPDPGHVHRARVLLQLLPRPAAGARGRGASS